MHLNAVQLFRGFLASALALVFAFPPTLFAEMHLVTPADMQQELLKASQKREHTQTAVQELLSSDVGQKALQSVHVNQTQVTHAIANLSDVELAELAERAGVQAKSHSGDRQLHRRRLR
jgi:hypothetical protein